MIHRNNMIPLQTSSEIISKARFAQADASDSLAFSLTAYHYPLALARVTPDLAEGFSRVATDALPRSPMSTSHESFTRNFK